MKSATSMTSFSVLHERDSLGFPGMNIQDWFNECIVHAVVMLLLRGKAEGDGK